MPQSDPLPRPSVGPRPPYLHPDGASISIGFADGPDTLLAIGDGEIDRERAAMWVEQVRRIMGAEDSDAF